MANPNKPGGLSPVQYLNGAPWNGQARIYYIASGDTNAYAVGDPVDLASSGDSNGVPGVTLANVAGPLVGAIVGCGRYEALIADPSNLDSIVIPATKTHSYYVMVADDPQILFQIQEGNTTTYLTAANVGDNANLYAGSNNGFVSGYTMDNSTAATTNTLSLKLMGLVRTSDNAFGQYAKWLVRINNHRLANQVAGV